MSTAQPFCLRCKEIPLQKLPASNENITFYRCPTCNREYAQIPGKSLTIIVHIPGLRAKVRDIFKATQ